MSSSRDSSVSSASSSESEAIPGLEVPDVIDKYKNAGEIANAALMKVIEAVKPDAVIMDLCKLGDEEIEKGTGAVYNKKKDKDGNKLEKGVAFPTCVSVNECCGHFSPLTSDDPVVIKEGDLVKIDLGVHIDGYCAVVGFAVLATEGEQSEPITGRKADVVCAAFHAGEAAQRLVKPGNTNTQVTEMMNKIAEVYKCNMVEGVLSHELKRFVMDGNQVIIGKMTPEQRVEEFTFQANEAYGIDIIVSTGEGKPTERDARTTVYQRVADAEYRLKMKASRKFFTEVNNRFAFFPFTLRAFEDENIGRLGVKECKEHDLVTPYPVLWEKAGEFVVQYKFTVLVMPSLTHKITGQTAKVPFVKSEHKIEDEAIKTLLASSVTKKKSKKKKKKAADKGKGESSGAQ